MTITLSKLKLHHQKLATQGFIFWPSPERALAPCFALMTHGYTASKNDQFSWASRLCEEGVTVALFDLPGHYLGDINNEVENFEDFTSAHELFACALEEIRHDFLTRYPLYQHFLEPQNINLVLAGHSLGALLALKSLTLSQFKDYKRLAVAVGFGRAPSPKSGETNVHLFQTALFKNTLNLRAQLVSPALSPENVFAWIKKEKEILQLPGERIHLINGMDDMIVAPDGAEVLMAQLEKSGSIVSLERPSKLPHHDPALAASYIKSFLRKNNYFS